MIWVQDKFQILLNSYNESKHYTKFFFFFCFRILYLPSLVMFKIVNSTLNNIFLLLLVINRIYFSFITVTVLITKPIKNDLICN